MNKLVKSMTIVLALISSSYAMEAERAAVIPCTNYYPGGSVAKNPVLDGMLGYERPSDSKQFHFKVKDLVKDGTFDLSNKVIFESAPNYLVLTTDPEIFFQIDKKSDKVVILIAPRSMIEEKLESSAAPFKPVMADWKEDNSPIGIFWGSRAKPPKRSSISCDWL